MKQYSKALIFIIIFVSISVCTIFIVRNYYKKMSYISGDEPHYIMMVDSLLKDGDFNLKNDYQLGRSKTYYPIEGLFPHLAPFIDYKSSNGWYSIHTVGLPILVAVAYWLGGVMGARLLVILLQLTSLPLFYLVLKRYLGEKRAITGLFIIVGCSIFWQNLGSIFPDLIFVSFILASIIFYAKKDVFSNLFLSIVIFIGYLVHTKVILILGPLYLAHILFLSSTLGFKKFLKDYYYVLLIPILGAIVYSFYLSRTYGIIFPSQIYGSKGQLFRGNIIINLLAILFDRVKGLFVYFPTLLVCGPYLYYLANDASKKIININKNKIINKELFLTIAILVGSFLLLITQLGFDDWSGSNAPNGRYMLVFIFLATFLIAKYINYKNKLEVILLGVVTTISYFISLLFIAKPFIFMDPGSDNFITNRITLLKYMPLFQISSGNSLSRQVLLSAFLMLFVLIINVLLIIIYKRPKNVNQ